jgi:hypothetical protein
LQAQTGLSNTALGSITGSPTTSGAAPPISKPRYIGTLRGRATLQLAAEYIDPLVARVRRAVAHWRATGEIQSPPAEIPEDIITQAALGPGRPLDSTARTRMEQAMDTSLAHIRLHDDTVAAGVVSSQHARAVALGSHIGFAKGEYRPGTTSGDAMLAHELAHTQQQSGAPRAGGAPDTVLERAADRQAMAILARLQFGGSSPLPLQAPANGLRLQRCKANTDEVDVPDVAADPVQEPSVSVSAPSTLDLSQVPTVDTGKHKRANADSLLFITGTRQGSTDRELFILPATGFVLEAPAEPTSKIVEKPQKSTSVATTATTTTVATTVLAMPAAGHAGVHLINTGKGVGILLDVAGTANDKGSPNVMLSEGLLRLQTELGIKRVDGAFISHAHGDHAGALEWMIKKGNLTGNKVWVMAGMESFTKGPLGRELTKLGTGDVSPQFPKGWKATPLEAQKLSQTPTVTTATLEVGDATLKMAVGTKELDRFVKEAKAGNWRKASALADAATPLTHVSWKGTAVEAIVVGDQRGTTIRNLADKLGDTQFREFVGNARVLVGLHHLGAIGTAGEVQGVQRLLSAMGGGAEPITVLAQTGPEFAVNERLVKALQEAGARVIILGTADKDAGIKVHSTGEIEQKGGKVAEIETTTKAAQARLQDLERAQRTLEKLPDFRGVPETTREQVIEGLKKEAQRLRDLLANRQTLATQDLHLEKQSAENVTKLAQNKAELAKVEGMEQKVGGALSGLALSAAELEILAKERAKAEKEGTTSEKLRELYGRVDPAAAKEILMEETTGKPRSRKAQKEAWRKVQNRLEAQAKTEAMMQPTTFQASAKGPAYLGLALQAFEIIAPGLEQWAKSRDDQEHEDFYMFYRDLIWWNEKGIRLPVKMAPDPSSVEDAQNSVARRLYDDTPKGQRGDVPEAVKKASPMKQLWVPPLDEWDVSERAAFFHSLRLWLDLHVRTIDDYYAELKTGITAPVRPKDSNEPWDEWQIHVGVVEDDHVHTAWQTSETLSEIMRETFWRADTGTQERIDARVKSIGKKSSTQSSYTAPNEHATTQVAAGGRGPVVGRLRVKAKKAKIYTLVDGKPKELDKSAERKMGFRFLEIADSSAPKGYVWVSPGDTDTAWAFGSLVGWQFRTSVKIQKAHADTNPYDPDFKGYGEKAPEKYMQGEELEAWLAYKAGSPGYYFNKKEEGIYRGSVSIYEKGPMIGGIVLMKRSDLESDE